MGARIRIATTATYPDGMASTYRIYCYAKGLIDEGVSLDVISTRSLYKYPGRTFIYKSKRADVPFTILWNADCFRFRFLEYLWAEVSSYVLLLYCLITLNRYDILWVYGMGAVPRLLLIPVLHLFRKKVVLELNEYPYGTEGSKFTKIPIVRRILTTLTLRWVFPQLDGVVVISENLKELVNQNAPFVPVLKIPILLDPLRAIQASTTDGRSKMDGRPHSYPYIFHAGSLSIQKDGIVKVVEAYAKAAIELRKSSVRLDLVLSNNRTFPEIWKTICQILKDSDLLAQLRVTGYLAEAELHEYLRYSAVLVVNKPSSFQNRYNFPTKVGDYLLSGRPVIVATEGTELNNYLIDNVNSKVLPPDDVDKMAKSIVTLLLNPAEAHSIGQGGRLMALDRFAYRKNAVAIESFFGTL